MTILPFEISDLSTLNDIKPHDWQDIAPYFQFYLSNDFCFPFKVVDQDKLVGTCSIIVHDEVAWLAHIIVSPDYRNKGIGQLITKHLIELAHTKKCTTLNLIATDLGAPVYTKLGFETVTEYVFFKDLNPTNPDFTSEYIIPFHPNHEKEIANLDRLTSGENRTPHLAKHAPHGFVFYRNNRVEGYYLPTFTEGHIIADTSEAGVELLKMKLIRDNKLGFPKDNLNALNFFHSMGHQEFMTMKRMRMGVARATRLDKIYSRIGGYLG